MAAARVEILNLKVYRGDNKSSFYLDSLLCNLLMNVNVRLRLGNKWIFYKIMIKSTQFDFPRQLYKESEIKFCGVMKRDLKYVGDSES